MIHRVALFLSIVLSSTFIVGMHGAWAQSNEEEATVEVPDLPPPPYESRLLRLAEILGSVQYLRSLCNAEQDKSWQESMQALLDSETAGEADRREHLTAGYNRGFRAFASVYTSCTDAALIAEDRYRREGATLVAEIVSRYGN